MDAHLYWEVEVHLQICKSGLLWNLPTKWVEEDDDKAREVSWDDGNLQK